MNAADMPFADTFIFRAKLDNEKDRFSENSLLRYDIISSSTLHIYDDNRSATIRIPETADISDRLSACRERSRLRVEKYDRDPQYMLLSLLEYVAIKRFESPLTIIVDDSILPQLRNNNINSEREAVDRFNSWFLFKVRTGKKQDKGVPNEVYAFSIGRERLELISKSFRLIIDEAPQTHYLRMVDIQRRRNIPEGLMQLISAPDIVFTDDKSIRGEVIRHSNEIYRSLIQDNTELLSLWTAYNNCELEMYRQKAAEMGYVKYSGYYKAGNMIHFKLADSLSVPGDFIDDDFFYEALPSSDFNENDYLNKNNSGAIAVGHSPDRKDIGRSEFSLELCEEAALKSIPRSGVLYPGIRGSEIQGKRRQQAQQMIRKGACRIPQLKILLQSGQSVGNTPKSRPPITAKLENYIFKDAKGLHFNDGQKSAIAAALNTPDVAIIQGPPGTGKTTVIQAIIKRINETENGKARILITSTQHDAVDNVSGGVYYNGVPVNRASSGKRGGQNDAVSVYDWIDQMYELCDNWLKQNRQDDYAQDFIALYEQLDSLRNDRSVEALQAVRERLSAQKFSSVPLQIIDTIIRKKTSGENALQEDQRKLSAHLDVQRLDKKSFLEDGAGNLKQLIRYLKYDIDHEEWIGAGWKQLSRISSDEPNLEELLRHFATEIDSLRGKVTSNADTREGGNDDYEALLDDAAEAVRKEAASMILRQDSSGKLELIEDFKHELTSAFNVRTLIRSYSLINAATCQQAASKSLSETMHGFDECYDYVIIDEAARSNPLDLMIPMTMGKKLILVGDHKQLPHMLADDVVKKVIENNPNDPKIGEMLKESLFVRLYNLMSSDDKKNIRSGNNSRVVMLNTQFRMHPDIGSLISKLFYEGKLQNGCSSKDKAHNLGVYDNAALAWLDIPAGKDYPHESSRGHSRYRSCEVDVIERQLRRILDINVRFTFGIITFYKEQSLRIRNMIDKSFPDQAFRIQVGTVDAFQGKEFDIVFLSTVRSNKKPVKKDRVGFLDDENRLCVAFSRAKRLLVSVGDASTVTAVDSLNELFKECKEGNGYYEQIH